MGFDQGFTRSRPTAAGGGGGGSGDVTGPGSSTNQGIARFSGTGGKTLQNSTITIDGGSNVGGMGSLQCGAITTTAAFSGSTTVTAGSFIGGNLNRHFINELGLAYATAATITIATGSCTDSTNSVFMDHTASVTVDITDSGINGLDTGAEATSTWYAVFLVSGSSGVGGLLSLNQTTPTMPSGFTFKRRIGWVRNDGSDNFLKFVMYGSTRERRVDWNESKETILKILDGVNPTVFTNVDCSGLKPPTAQEVWAQALATAGTNWTVVRSEDNDNNSSGQIMVRNDIAAVGMNWLAITGSNLQYDVGAASYLNLYILGYKDIL